MLLQRKKRNDANIDGFIVRSLTYLQVVFYWTLVVRQVSLRFDSEPYLRPQPVPPLSGGKGRHQITLSAGQEQQVQLKPSNTAVPGGIG